MDHKSNENNLLGVVLCGGMSLRMGEDKGLLKIRDLHWADHCRKILSEIVQEVVFSVNPSQLNDYKKLFQSEKIISDSCSAEGPLRGILSVHNQFQDLDLLVLACDMISMNVQVPALLQNEYLQNPDFEFYAFKIQKRIEPLCGIYTSLGLKKIELRLSETKNSSFGLKKILAQSNSYFLESEGIDDSYFRNFNSPEDVKKIEQGILYGTHL